MTLIKAACPLCGPHHLKMKPLWQGQYRFVACLECKAAGPVAKTEDEAVRLFEQRHEPLPYQMALM